MKEIETREDVNKLVKAFYVQIRKHDLLGPIFNSHIAEEQWPAHLEKLTDFWETILFGVQKFKGSPSLKHIEVDKNLNYGITQEHFNQWVSLWHETIDKMFEGEVAQRAKEASNQMAVGQYTMLWRYRPENY
ncbi:globin [Capnocytophaga stomatis]|uniref:Globin n=2 Tax=Capnocytophaga stomatis TaxID=1848904 RepID=A0A250FWI8_9FLAO|nr:group III truncated hemoglobin [Capnocytophaga stomatis]ATA89371.1 globin [Capnocytophaga stomatis]